MKTTFFIEQIFRVHVNQHPYLVGRWLYHVNDQVLKTVRYVRNDDLLPHTPPQPLDENGNGSAAKMSTRFPGIINGIRIVINGIIINGIRR